MNKLIFTLLLSQFYLSVFSQTTYETSNLRLVLRSNGTIDSLVTVHNGINWIKSSSPLISNSNSSVNTNLNVTTETNGQIKLDMTLTNTTASTATTYVSLPRIYNIFPKTGNTNGLSYFFPKKGTVISNKVATHEEKYSAKFPHQFIDVFHPQLGGIYFMTKDTVNREKDYRVQKTSNKVNMSCTFKVVLGPNEVVQMPSTYIGGHQGDWHDALHAYKDLLATWFTPAAPRKEWFQESFNIRQHFMHQNYGDEVYDPETGTFSIYDEIQKDIEEFGGIDFCHIFDWSMESEVYDQLLRVGKYNPMEYLGSTAWNNFIQEVATVRANGVRFGLYFEGYLFSKAFGGCNASNGDLIDWTVKDTNGNSVNRWGENYRDLCPYSTGWQDYLSGKIRDAFNMVGNDGAYVDQLGFGYQEDYKCFDTSHGHYEPSFISAGEGQLLSKIRNQISDDKVIYTEDTPVDYNMQFQDGSFSYTIGRVFNKYNDGRINITRFINPDFKNFHIINVDAPFGTPIDELRIIFFNGEGLWLAGPISSFDWFPQTSRNLITKTYNILHKHKDAFSSLDVEPLVKTLNTPVIFANRFIGDNNKTVWTFFNKSDASFNGTTESIAVDHVSGATYYDEWNKKQLDNSRVRIDKGKAYIKVQLDPWSVGCIVQSVDNSSAKNSKIQKKTLSSDINTSMIAPNPVKGRLNIINYDYGDNYEIRSLTGVYMKSFSDSICDISELPSGIYILFNTRTNQAEKFVKE